MSAELHQIIYLQCDGENCALGSRLIGGMYSDGGDLPFVRNLLPHVVAQSLEIHLIGACTGKPFITFEQVTP